MALTVEDRRLYGTLCFNFIVMGIAMTIFSAMVPQLIGTFKWTYIETGLVLAANSIGGFIATFVSGLLLKHFSSKILLICGLCATTCGLAFFGYLPFAWYNGLLYCVIGAGNGFTEVITNSIVIRVEKPGQSRLMNLMHAGFCSGAALGPLIVGFLTLKALPIPLYFLGAAAIQLLCIVFLFLCAFPTLHLSRAALSTDAKNPVTESVFFKPLLWVLGTVLFLYVGVELALSNWIAEYFHRFRTFDDSQSALLVSVYWAGLLAGRIGLFLFHRGKSQERMLAILSGTSVIAFVASITIPQGILAVCALFLTGLAFSGIYPIVMSMVGVGFKNSTTAIGFTATAGGVGLFVFPFATGAIAQTQGLSTALLIMAACDAVLFGTALFLWWRSRQSRQRYVA